MLIRRVSLLAVVLVCFLFVLSPVYASPSSGQINGKVTEVIVSAGYTYVEIDSGTEKVWAAGPNTRLRLGDEIGISTHMPMANFHSKSLQRDFAMIYFVDGYSRDNHTAAPHSSMDDMAAGAYSQSEPEAMAKPVAGIAVLKGGQTIADIHADKQRFKDKVVRVRGLVTKFSPAIMGKNWVHIMDGSSGYDLTITTSGRAAMNDVVIIEGRLALDKDFGYGYMYPIIIEEAKITKE